MFSYPSVYHTLAADSSKVTKKDEFEKRGVKLDLFQAVRDLALKRVPDPKHWTMSRTKALLIGDHEILKAGNRWSGQMSTPALTFESKSSLIDLLHAKYFQTPHPLLGLTYSQAVSPQSNFFLSFSYGDSFVELVDALENFVDTHEDTHSKDQSFFWFDMFVNNQWEASDHTFEWWATTFRTAVHNIGHTLLFVSPCWNPNLLTRAWCLYEISCSGKLSIAVSKAELDAFHETLLSPAGVQQMLSQLSQINLERCESYLQSDREQIFTVARAMEGGIRAFNEKVIRLLRSELSASGRAFATARREETKLKKELMKAFMLGKDNVAICNLSTDVIGIMLQYADDSEESQRELHRAAVASCMLQNDHLELSHVHRMVELNTLSPSESEFDHWTHGTLSLVKTRHGWTRM